MTVKLLTEHHLEFLSLQGILVYIYSTTKETHQSLFRAIMVKYLRNENIFYTMFLNNQLCIKLLNNVIVLLKPVHAVHQCKD